MEAFDNEKGSPIGDITGSKSTNITLKMRLSDFINYFDPGGGPQGAIKNDSTYGLGSDKY